KTGAVEWHAALPGPVTSSVLVAHGIVLAVTQTGQAVAINQQTGKIVKDNEIGGKFSATFPILWGKTVYLTNLDGKVIARSWTSLVK
ncbi:MAG: PQQ-binding-like beta-propeller repeat protein, partial [Firmicutes bacterium]|nr:PQQ-binding-like beta-propeller repeat protein [Bacillota bacterium]